MAAINYIPTVVDGVIYDEASSRFCRRCSSTGSAANAADNSVKKATTDVTQRSTDFSSRGRYYRHYGYRNYRPYYGNSYGYYAPRSYYGGGYGYGRPYYGGGGYGYGGPSISFGFGGGRGW